MGTIKYKVVARSNPAAVDAPAKYYATLTKREEATVDTLTEEIVAVSSLSRGDVLSVIANLEEAIAKHLKEGDQVKLGMLGKFYLTARSEGKSTAAEVKSTSIKEVVVRFTPSDRLAGSLDASKLDFEKTDATGDDDEEKTSDTRSDSDSGTSDSDSDNDTDPNVGA